MTPRRAHKRSILARVRKERHAILFSSMCTIVMCTSMRSSTDSFAQPKSLHTTPKTSLYPHSTGRLHFDHKTHKNTPCLGCHKNATTSTQAAQNLNPNMNACASCHAKSSKKPHAQPALEQCASCHINYNPTISVSIHTSHDWNSVRPAPMNTPPLRPRLKFNHRVHTTRTIQSTQQQSTQQQSTQQQNTQHMPCVSCHAPTTGGTMGYPSMAQCTSCHEHKATTDTCNTCHLTQKDGKLQTSFPTQRSPRKPMRLLPQDHTVDWLKRHGPVARAQGDECASCHQETTCTECHSARNAKPMQMHPPSFVHIHAIAARGQESNCTSCHRQETFCTSCHVQARATMQEPHRPPTQRAFHPKGWLDGNNMSNHGVLARRNINDCASCHQERDCISCHQGINPHPPTFRVSCSSWLKANPTPCAKCHTDLNALKSLCL